MNAPNQNNPGTHIHISETEEDIDIDAGDEHGTPQTDTVPRNPIHGTPQTDPEHGTPQ